MHELSIAYSLVNTAVNAAQAESIENVQAVHLRVGMLSGILEDALLFGYDIAVQDTILEGSKLIIESVPVTVNCPTCGEVELSNIQRFRCPNCDAITADIVRGRELEIFSLEYEEAEKSNESRDACYPNLNHLGKRKEIS